MLYQRKAGRATDIWNHYVATVTIGRNLLINTEVSIEVRGKINVISPEQANPQVLLSGPDAIHVYVGSRGTHIP